MIGFVCILIHNRIIFIVTPPPPYLSSPSTCRTIRLRTAALLIPSGDCRCATSYVIVCSLRAVSPVPAFSLSLIHHSLCGCVSAICFGTSRVGCSSASQRRRRRRRPSPRLRFAGISLLLLLFFFLFVFLFVFVCLVCFCSPRCVIQATSTTVSSITTSTNQQISSISNNNNTNNINNNNLTSSEMAKSVSVRDNIDVLVKKDFHFFAVFNNQIVVAQTNSEQEYRQQQQQQSNEIIIVIVTEHQCKYPHEQQQQQWPVYVCTAISAAHTDSVFKTLSFDASLVYGFVNYCFCFHSKANLVLRFVRLFVCFIVTEPTILFVRSCALCDESISVVDNDNRRQRQLRYEQTLKFLSDRNLMVTDRFFILNCCTQSRCIFRSIIPS